VLRRGRRFCKRSSRLARMRTASAISGWWCGTDCGEGNWPSGIPSRRGPGNGIQGLAEGDDGALLFSPRTGIRRLVGTKLEAYPLPNSVQHSPSRGCAAIAMGTYGSELQTRPQLSPAEEFPNSPCESASTGTVADPNISGSFCIGKHPCSRTILNWTNSARRKNRIIDRTWTALGRNKPFAS
jgi:hypothetical protein